MITVDVGSAVSGCGVLGECLGTTRQILPRALSSNAGLVHHIRTVSMVGGCPSCPVIPERWRAFLPPRDWERVPTVFQVAGGCDGVGPVGHHATFGLRSIGR